MSKKIHNHIFVAFQVLGNYQLLMLWRMVGGPLLSSLWVLDLHVHIPHI